MAKVKFVGLQELDFETRDGEQIKGLKLHICYPDENVMGLAADSKFLNSASCRNLGLTVDTLTPMIGQDVDLETNLKGKVTGLRLYE